MIEEKTYKKDHLFCHPCTEPLIANKMPLDKYLLHHISNMDIDTFYIVEDKETSTHSLTPLDNAL